MGFIPENTVAKSVLTLFEQVGKEADEAAAKAATEATPA